MKKTISKTILIHFSIIIQKYTNASINTQINIINNFSTIIINSIELIIINLTIKLIVIELINIELIVNNSINFEPIIESIILTINCIVFVRINSIKQNIQNRKHRFAKSFYLHKNIIQTI